MNKTKIAIFTTSRAEFGIFVPLLKELYNCNVFETLLFVGGAHLASELGKTINEIRNQNFQITATFDYLLNEDSAYSSLKSLSVETSELALIFKEYNFDFVCVLGDRIELLPIVQASLIFNKPIIHLYGGEISQGAIDEQVRHIATKASHLHFTACEEYANNIRNMGEQNWRVFNVGGLGIDNFYNLKKISKKDLFEKLNLDENKKTVLLTYHPVTNELKITLDLQINNIFSALSNFNFQVVITSPNFEVDRNVIIDIINSTLITNNNYKYFESLGMLNYHSLLPHCEFVIGNSSSGIIEVPYYKIPTINIGDRQKGRLRHESVIDTDYSVTSIKSGIEKAMSSEFRNKIQNQELKFGDGNAAKKIVEILKNIKIDENLMRKKLEFE